MFKFNLFKSDLIAGITVALVLIPQSLAYAQLAGLPAQFGLYAALLPPLIAAVFGSSKHLATGPVAVLSLMTAASLSQLAPQGSSEYIGLALLMAFSLGIFQLILGLMRLGGLVSFLSHPVIYGFTNAAAIIIATTQLSKFFNVSAGHFDHHYQTVISVFQKSIIQTDWFTLALGIWALLLMYSLKSLNKKFPVVLITVFTATLLSVFIGYHGPVIGAIPLGLPGITMPVINMEVIGGILPVVIAMGLIGFTEAVSVAQAIAVKTKDRIDPNKELIGQGLANTVGSFFQSFPVAGSFSRTAVNFQAGGKSAVSSIVTSIAVLLTLLFFTKLLYFIPSVVLAAIIVFSVGGLIDFKKIKYIWYTNKFDAIAAVLTFAATLYFAPHLDIGVALGVIFSVGHYLYRNVHPRIVFLSKYKDGQMHDVERFKMDRCDNIAVIRLDAPLFFANAAYFENEIINDVIKNQKIRDILLVGSGINEIDSTGEETLMSLLNSLNTAGKKLYISEFKAPVLQLLAKAGFLEQIKKEHIFPTTEEAVLFLTVDLERKHAHKDLSHCPLKKYIKPRSLEHIIMQDKSETIAYYFNKLLGHNNRTPRFTSPGKRGSV